LQLITYIMELTEIRGKWTQVIKIQEFSQYNIIDRNGFMYTGN